MRPSKEGRYQLQHRLAKQFCPYSTGQQQNTQSSLQSLPQHQEMQKRSDYLGDQAHCTKVMPVTRKKTYTNSREYTKTIVWLADHKSFISIFSQLPPSQPSHLVLWLCYSCHGLPSSELDFLVLFSCVCGLFAVIPGDSIQSQIVRCSHFADRHSVVQQSTPSVICLQYAYPAAISHTNRNYFLFYCLVS